LPYRWALVDLDLYPGDARPMSKLKTVLFGTRKVLHANAPTILAGFAVSGTVTTAYLAAKGAYKARGRIGAYPENLTNREKFEETWELYLPAIAAGTVTIGCIIIGTRTSARRAAAAYSVAALSERALEEYREKIIETIGEKREQNARDEIAQERVSKNPPGVIFENNSGFLCCELYTGRYFMSDMETLRRAQNDINARIIQELYVSLDDFYILIGLGTTSKSADVGWDSSKLLELDFTTTLTPDNKPCLAFNYNYVKAI
jgi:hypothetical protein